jgi:predicted TIM-barrel fold metal-dependent hydrolase
MHVWRAAALGDPAAETPTIVSPRADVPRELALAYLDEHGVDRAVLVQPVFRGEDNSDVAECAAAAPERFAAVCVVDPRVPGAGERLDHWATHHACRGLRLRPRIPGEDAAFGDPATDVVWEQARRLGVVISVLAGPEHLATLAVLAERFPEVAVVVDHLAHPDAAAGARAAAFQALLDLARHPHVFIKVSGYYYFSKQSYPYEDCWDLVRALHDRFGPDRLIWGSDFPHVLLKTGYRRSLLLAERFFAFFTAADRELFLGGNAARLYWPRAAGP